MNAVPKPRLVWFDANRVCAAFGVVLIHCITDFSGGIFLKASMGERFVPVFLRSVAEFSGSEMFFMFSLFLMAMRVDHHRPGYFVALGEQARRLLVPFAVWTIFYAFFRLIKADAFNYAPSIWGQLADWKMWVSHFLLGTSQYQMHILPTLFALFMSLSGQAIGDAVSDPGNRPVRHPGHDEPHPDLSLGPETRPDAAGLPDAHDQDHGLCRVWAGGLCTLWPVEGSYPTRRIQAGSPGRILFRRHDLSGNRALLWRGAVHKAVGRARGLGFLRPFPDAAEEVRAVHGRQFREWSPRWSLLARYTFGVYLIHPMIIDLYDVGVVKSVLSGMMDPWLVLSVRYAIALPGSFVLARLLSRTKLLAWTIGLGPAPWEWRRNAVVARTNRNHG